MFSSEVKELAIEDIIFVLETEYDVSTLQLVWANECACGKGWHLAAHVQKKFFHKKEWIAQNVSLEGVGYTLKEAYEDLLKEIKEFKK